VPFEGYFLFTMFTISAFYLGETLQANTTSEMSAASKNLALNASSASISVNEAPAIIRAFFYPSRAPSNFATAPFKPSEIF